MIIGYQLRMAWRGLWRTPRFTLVMVGALALGIGTWYAENQVVQFVARVEPDENPGLRNVALERPRLGGTAGSDVGSLMAHQLAAILLAATDAQALLGSGIPRRETITFGASGVLEPEGGPPEPVRVRYAGRDLFPLFDIPFAEGEAWPAEHDGGLGAARDAELVVIDERLARRLFGAGPALDRRVRVDGTERRVVGVIAGTYTRRQRLYDMAGFRYHAAEIYLPLAAAAPAHAAPEMSHVAGPHGPSFTDRVASDEGWLELWIEVADADGEAAFAEHARRHLEAERQAGRAHAPDTVVLRSPAAWRRDLFSTRGSINLWPVLAWLALAACVLNLVRLLMAKLADRSHELGVLRAFGAERRSLVFQLLLEAGLLGLLAGVLGVLLGLAMMPVAMGAVSLPEPIPVLRAIDALRAIGLSTAGALLAAVYPALRLCRGTPSMQLRGL